MPLLCQNRDAVLGGGKMSFGAGQLPAEAGFAPVLQQGIQTIRRQCEGR